MPRAASLDGNVDHVMRSREIANELVRIAGHPYTRDDETPPAPVSETDGDPIAEIINLLRVRTRVDFTHYKQTTIRRRILRASTSALPPGALISGQGP
jgi:two-component system CheB/CheR fusion protein